MDLTFSATALAEHICSILGPTARAVLHYGSRAQGRAARPDSAFDFFIVVDSYREAYRALAAELGGPYRQALAFALAWVLPPNVIAVRRRVGLSEYEAKCVILSARHFRRECSRRARDHFVRGRLFQHLLLVWSRDPESTEKVQRGLREVQEGSFDWVRVFLPPRFEPVEYCRTLLEVSLAHEIRPEAGGHADRLFAAQRDVLLGIYGPVLERLEQRGMLARDGERYVQPRLAGTVARLRIHAYFRFSKLRATLRLLKHPLLYNGWLDYLLQKIDRSTGETIQLTERERRWPLIFLWPRAIRYLRSRPQQQR